MITLLSDSFQSEFSRKYMITILVFLIHSLIIVCYNKKGYLYHQSFPPSIWWIIVSPCPERYIYSPHHLPMGLKSGWNCIPEKNSIFYQQKIETQIILHTYLSNYFCHLNSVVAIGFKKGLSTLWIYSAQLWWRNGFFGPSKNIVTFSWSLLVGLAFCFL